MGCLGTGGNVLIARPMTAGRQLQDRLPGALQILQELRQTLVHERVVEQRPQHRRRQGGDMGAKLRRRYHRKRAVHLGQIGDIDKEFHANAPVCG
jgi:hypothetical protein